jgi:hypothetical protein
VQAEKVLESVFFRKIENSIAKNMHVRIFLGDVI